MNSGSWRGKWTAEEQNKRCSNSETQTVIYGSNEKGRTRNWHISLSAWPSNKLDCIWSIAEFWPSIVLSVRKPQRKQTEVWKLEVRAEPMQTIFHKWQCRNLPGKTTKWQWRAVSAAATGYRHQNPVFKKENQKYYKDMARSHNSRSQFFGELFHLREALKAVESYPLHLPFLLRTPVWLHLHQPLPERSWWLPLTFYTPCAMVAANTSSDSWSAALKQLIHLLNLSQAIWVALRHIFQ